MTPGPLLLALAAAQAAPADGRCAHDERAALALPFAAFDQDLGRGWQTLEERGCLVEAADLLQAYRLRRQPLSERERSILSWHEGQVRAIAGDDRAAVPLLMRGVSDEAYEIDFVDYALGTVAFLQRDRAGLAAARARLAAFPKPATFQDTMTVSQNGKPVTFRLSWPPNLDVLDGLIRCFDQPYKVAYACRVADR